MGFGALPYLGCLLSKTDPLPQLRGTGGCVRGIVAAAWCYSVPEMPWSAGERVCEDSQPAASGGVALRLDGRTAALLWTSGGSSSTIRQRTVCTADADQHGSCPRAPLCRVQTSSSFTVKVQIPSLSLEGVRPKILCSWVVRMCLTCL